jgi:type II secretory pathway component PulC
LVWLLEIDEEPQVVSIKLSFPFFVINSLKEKCLSVVFILHVLCSYVLLCSVLRVVVDKNTEPLNSEFAQTIDENLEMLAKSESKSRRFANIQNTLSQ